MRSYFDSDFRGKVDSNKEQQKKTSKGNTKTSGSGNGGSGTAGWGSSGGAGGSVDAAARAREAQAAADARAAALQQQYLREQAKKKADEEHDKEIARKVKQLYKDAKKEGLKVGRLSKSERDAMRAQEAGPGYGTGSFLLDPTKTPVTGQQSTPSNPARYGNNPLLGGNGQEVTISEADPETKIKWYVDNKGEVQLGEQSALAAPDERTRQVATIDSLNKAGIGDPYQRGQNPNSSVFAGTPEEVRQQSVTRENAKRKDALEKALIKSRRSTGFNGKFKQMSWDEYNSLGRREKAAINFNTVMQQAFEGDNAFAEKHGGADHRVTLDEVAAGKRDAYRTSYEKLFGEGKSDKEIIYAPKTVGVIGRVAGMEDATAGLDEYMSGGGFITDKDRRQGLFRRGEGSGPGGEYTDPRRQWLSNIVDYQVNLDKALKKGRVILNGAKAKVGIAGASVDQIAGLVDAAETPTTEDLMQMLALSGKSPNAAVSARFGNGTGGLDVSSLANPNRLSKINTMTALKTSIENAGGSLDLSKDKAEKVAYLKQYGISPREWQNFLKQVESSTEKSKNDEMASRLASPQA